MAKQSWLVGLGALVLAAGAFYVLMNVGGEVGEPPGGPALDDIDAKSRAAMRDVLREAGRED